MHSLHDISPDLQAQVLRLPERAAGGLIYIEQFVAAPDCPTSNRPFLQAVNHEQKVAIFFRPTCKTWGCPVCGQTNKRRWIVRAVEGVKALHEQQLPVGFLTLTSHEKLRGAASFRVWPHAWNKLYHRYRREVGSSQRAYFAVPERHQDGSLHTHALITGDLSERWWKDNARQCGLGFMADLQEVIDLGVAGYVGKYLGKTLDEGWPRGKRRVNTSRSWPALPDMPLPDGWTFAAMPKNEQIQAVAGIFYRDGYDVTLASAAGSWALIEQLSDSQEEQI